MEGCERHDRQRCKNIQAFEYHRLERINSRLTCPASQDPPRLLEATNVTLGVVRHTRDCEISCGYTPVQVDLAC